MKMSDLEINQLVDMIRKIAKQEISSELSNFEYTYTGIVKVDNSNGTFDIEIPGINGTYSSILNKSGETLSVNDSVIIKAKNKDMGNAYISSKNGVAFPVPTTT